MSVEGLASDQLAEVVSEAVEGEVTGWCSGVTVTPREEDEMITRCAVTEAAARLTLELEAYPIPDAFDANGKYWQVVTRVRNQYTNYRDLLAALPECPFDCGRRTAAGCWSYDYAVDMLEMEARRLASLSLDAWQRRQEKRRAEVREPVA